MPTECELNAVIASTTTFVTDIKDNNNIHEINETIKKKLQQQQEEEEEESQQQQAATITLFTSNNQSSNIMENDMSTSQTSNSNSNGRNHTSKKTGIISPDPTAYVTKARVTRPTPPPPPYNPMQFVQIKPCNLYQSAQEQLKKAEEVKKIKEIRKEEPEDWQNNLDNWKSSRRKRVEHIIDRVVEVKKLELEEHDRARRKSKTFFEMIEGRGERAGRGLNKLASLAVYNEDESNDLSDLGIGTSSASGKSSLSDDYDNNSVMSDNINELQKTIREQNNKQQTNNATREYISSPGYETSSSTAPASSPDPCEYTYEGAIQDYKQRVSRAVSGLTSLTLNKLSGNTSNKNLKNDNTNGAINSKDSTPERLMSNGNAGNVDYKESYPPRRGSKIEDRLIGFEVQSPSEEYVEQKKVDVPKIDISKRKEIFENNQQQEQLFKSSNNNEPKSTADAGNSKNDNGQGETNGTNNVPRSTLKDRFKRQNSSDIANTKETCRLSSDITSIKERLQSLEQQQQKAGICSSGSIKTSTLVDISSVPPLKERLSSLQSAATKEEIRKPPVKLVDARQLEIMKNEEEKVKKVLNDMENEKVPIVNTNEALIGPRMNCIKNEGSQIVDEALIQEQDDQMHATIEALALEEKQLAEAANIVNQIEADFEELNLNTLSLAPLATSSLNVTSSSSPTTSNINDNMEYSVSSTNQDFSYNRSNNINCNESNIVNICSGYGNNSLLSDEVKGISALKSSNAFKTSAVVQRRSTNEMIHAKNLLKMFKETFPNEIELNENVDVANVSNEINKKISHEIQPSVLEKRIIENTQTVKNNNSSPLNFSALGEEKLTTKPPKCPIVRPCSPISQTVKLPTTLECFSPPKIARSSLPLAHYLPSPEQNADSPFSINGRVEIFNSKYMNSTSPNSIIHSLSPTSIPTMTITMKSKASQINDTEKNAIEFPKQKQQQEEDEEQQKLQAKPLGKSVTAVQTLNEAIPSVVNKEKRNNPTEIKSKPMKARIAANEPNKKCYQLNNKIIKDEQQQQQEIVTCAPTVTVLNPEELPKPNTVKKLSSCFQQQQQQQSQQQQQPLNTSATVHVQENVQGSKIIPQASPKPLPRTSLTVKHPSTVIVTNNQMSVVEKPLKIDALEEKEKTLSLISTSSSNSSTNSSGMCSVIEVNKSKPNDLRSSSSSDSTVIVDHPTITTQAQIHIKEKVKDMSNFVSGNNNDKQEEKQKEKKSLVSKLKGSTNDIRQAIMPPLLICTPNESSLYKLAASSPLSPRKQLDIKASISSSSNVENNVALCSGLLPSLAISPNKTYFQRQQTIDEVPFEKVISQGNCPPRSTGYSEINHDDIKNTQIVLKKAKRQKSVQEEPCNKIDVFSLPVNKQEPSTKCISVSPTEIRKTDHFFSSAGGPLKPLSKPNSPIMAARAAHSKALIETCEKIIAEEKLASSQLKSTLPISPRSTPILGKKSKLPKPLIVCCKPIESISETDVKPIQQTMSTDKDSPLEEIDDNVVIARMHVVETQIKVTTSTPPSSPKCKVKSLQSPSPPSQRSPKKTKNIFDFLKRNFGVGSSHPSNENLNINADTVSALSNPQQIELTHENIQQTPEEIIKYDEIHNIENSKFYLPSDDMKPPPLPRTPAPVNIEIKKCFITDEIVEDGKTELDLTREINELLDEELNKLNNQAKEFKNE